MSKNLSPIARAIAAEFHGKPLPSRDTVRDACDTASGANFDCFQLDLLFDMVWKLVAHKEEWDEAGIAYARKVERDLDC